MRYVLVMLGSLVGLVIVAYLLLYLLISVGCIYPANYAEQKINEAYDTILRADKVTAEMIPALCDYVIFSENGEKIGGDLSEQYEQIAWNVAKYGGGDFGMPAFMQRQRQRYGTDGAERPGRPTGTPNSGRSQSAHDRVHRPYDDRRRTDVLRA